MSQRNTSFRPEPPSHVAQQSRRDKLRIQQTHPFGSDPNPDLLHVRDITNCDTLYDPTTMLDFTIAANESSSFINPSTSTFHHSSCSNDNWLFNTVGSSSYQDGGSDLSSQFYQNTLQGIDMSTLVPSPNVCNVTTSWVDQQRQLMQFNSEGGGFMRAKVEGGVGGLIGSAAGSETSTQGLSLSLSSNPPSDLHLAHLDQVGFSCSPNPKFSAETGRACYGIAGAGSSVEVRRVVGPLGPFTGYATILKTSKFLKPAQQLLDEFCSVVMGSKAVKQMREYDCGVERGNSGCGSVTSSDGGVVGTFYNGSVGRGGNSGVSSSSFYSSTEGGGGGDDGGVSNCHSNRPEFQQKKAKLLYLQEEVCRRYKQYYQQMQMVVSSFESVAGLSAATPYTSLALKAVSKHFRSLKNAISNQLRHVSKILGEELMSSPSSSVRGETATTPRLKYIDHGLRKQKTAGDNGTLSFLDNNQPVWRPQRGLPERAVAVLRAWLFEHFLHPYPTDTDKHMLATQTGLSRNQVSNWFINARVRLWKPMVEEIHTLETKGMAGMDLNSSNKNNARLDGNPNRPCSDQRSEAESSKQFDFSSMGSMGNEEATHGMQQWHREKRSRMEDCMIPGGMDSGLMSFTYQGGMDIAGLGAVSLTLGLRRDEGAQQQQQQQQMRHFGSHMLHDFVG